jgi:hypothetical protein
MQIEGHQMQIEDPQMQIEEGPQHVDFYEKLHLQLLVENY